MNGYAAGIGRSTNKIKTRKYGKNTGTDGTDHNCFGGKGYPAPEGAVLSCGFIGTSGTRALPELCSSEDAAHSSALLTPCPDTNPSGFHFLLCVHGLKCHNRIVIPYA